MNEIEQIMRDLIIRKEIEKRIAEVTQAIVKMAESEVKEKREIEGIKAINELQEIMKVVGILRR